jgi:HlyD family secretion protein
MKKILALLVLLSAGGAGAWAYLRHAPPLQFRTAKVSKGDLKVSANATGQIFPFVQVQVGTQVTGVIQSLFVDFNSVVTAGQQVAQIDPAPFQSVVDQNRANLLSAQSNVTKTKASLVQAEKDLARDRELAKKDLIAPTDLDAAVATYDALVAQIEVAKAGVEQAKAALEASEVNLRYTKILSPIDGVVIQRSVDVGQTLSASLSAPTMYVIADTMKRVQIQASVAEADIGRVTEGQQVTFTVDAYREALFKGVVSQIRLFPTIVQNVVTYTVMIDADNPNGRLLPGMTANVTFQVAEYKAVRRIPNAALRFTPPWEPSADGAKEGPRKDGKDREDAAPDAVGKPARAEGRPRPEPHAPPTGPAAAPASPYVYKRPGAPEYHFEGGTGENGRPVRRRRSRVWILGAEGLSPVMVVPGATDGTTSEILDGDLQEGQDVVIGIVQESSEAGMSNPFNSARPPGMGGGGAGRR